MAKLFQKAMGEAKAGNRVGQYLLLIVGEITFVIVGILLALYINNWNLERQKEADVEAIFSEILKDLEKDIFYVKGSIALQERKDSLIQLVFKDSLTVADYESNPTLRNLIFRNRIKDLYDKGFVALMKNIDHIPPKFEPVMPALQLLYVQMKGHVVRSNQKVQTFVSGTISKWSNEHKWFYLYIRDGAVNKDAFEYFISDPMYKNEIALYRVYLIENVNSLPYIKSGKKSL